VAVRFAGRASKHGRDQVDHDLAIAGPDTGDQDLVCSCVVGASAAARRGKGPTITTSTTAKAAASTATWNSRAASASTKAPVPADNAEQAAAAASGKTWEGAASPSLAAIGAAKWTDAITAGAEEATTPSTTAEAPERTATSSAVTALPAVTGAAPVKSAAARVSATSPTSAPFARTAASTGDDQRRIIGADHERAAAPTTASHPSAADGDPQNFTRGQVEAAADLGTSPARHSSCITTLRAKGDGLIGAVDDCRRICWGRARVVASDGSRLRAGLPVELQFWDDADRPGDRGGGYRNPSRR
jgi:hypothetical protein